PQGGGSIEELASFLNLPSRNDLVLAVAWLLATLRADGPYPVLAISGEQGSAKTVLSKLLKALVDPNVAPVRSLAREERDLMIAAYNSHVLAFDKLSGLSHGLVQISRRTPIIFATCSRGRSAASERRIRCTAVPPPAPRSPSRRRRARTMADRRCRRAQGRAQALEAHASERGTDSARADDSGRRRRHLGTMD